MTGTAPTLSFDAPAHSISAPKSIHLHVITEEELCMLLSIGKDTSLEWGLATGGAGVGLAPNLIKVLAEVSRGTPLAGVDMLMALASVGLLAASAMCLSYYRTNRQAKQSIEHQIRSRHSGPTLVASQGQVAA